MSGHPSGLRKHDDNECSGPRPPVPGEESRVKKVGSSIDCGENSPITLSSHSSDDRRGSRDLEEFTAILPELGPDAEPPAGGPRWGRALQEVRRGGGARLQRPPQLLFRLRGPQAADGSGEDQADNRSHL